MTRKSTTTKTVEIEYDDEGRVIKETTVVDTVDTEGEDD